MPKIGRSIYRRKDGRFEGRFAKGRDSGGKLVYGSVYGKSYTEVEHRLAAFKNEDSEPAVFDKRALTFADTAKHWLSVISLKVKPSTYAGYVNTLDLHILPAMGERKTQSLTAEDINRFAKEKLDNGRVNEKGGLSAKTVRDMLCVIKAVMDFACYKNIIASRLSITYPKQRQKIMRVLSRREQTLLEAVLLRDVDIHKLGIFLSLYTGLRLGEVCALRWQDISGNFDTLSVRQTLQRIKNTDGGNCKTKIITDAPKSPRSVRDIPIPRFLSPYLCNFARDGAAHFLHTPKADFTEPRTMQNHFTKHIKTANIAAANYHCLRHTFATRCVEAGVDIKSLSEILGHTNVNITLNRYIHSSFKLKREGINKLERFIGR